MAYLSVGHFQLSVVRGRPFGEASKSILLRHIKGGGAAGDEEGAHLLAGAGDGVGRYRTATHYFALTRFSIYRAGILRKLLFLGMQDRRAIRRAIFFGCARHFFLGCA